MHPATPPNPSTHPQLLSAGVQPRLSINAISNRDDEDMYKVQPAVHAAVHTSSTTMALIALYSLHTAASNTELMQSLHILAAWVCHAPALWLQQYGAM